MRLITLSTFDINLILDGCGIFCRVIDVEFLHCKGVQHLMVLNSKGAYIILSVTCECFTASECSMERAFYIM